MLLPIAQELWSYNGIAGSRGFRWSGFYSLLNVLSHPKNSEWTWVYKFFVGGQLFFLLTGFLKIWPRISSIMVYFFTVNLFLKASIFFTGGEVLINILLFYMMFVHNVSKENKFYPYQNLLNNVFFRIMLIQVCVLYFFSCIYKLPDENWTSGEAIMYVSRIPHFSSATFSALFQDNVVLSAIFTYLTLLYQGLFPLLVWFKRIKIPFLIVGVAFHLAIAFFMGIFTFAIIMIISYILFLEDNHISRLKRMVMIKGNQKSLTGEKMVKR
ncbi:MAG: HTTM domain-containing protein [Crocinitomicaceae bacterium]|nr:HTTM domain-containing protein [Crocinitomicaceae bacterium]